MYCRRLWNDEGEKENRENEKESMSGKSWEQGLYILNVLM
jgi:hypothetical protein